MLKLFGRIPRWLTATLSLTAAAALPLAEVFLPGLHGWHLMLAALPVGAFVLLVVGLPQLAQWQAQQESRLNVRLEVEPSNLTIPAYSDKDDVIKSMLADEETVCMASLTAELEKQRPLVLRSDAAEGAPENGGAESRYRMKKAGSLSVREYAALARKQEAGAELTPEEEQQLLAANQAFASLKSSLDNLALIGRLSRPDTRTQEQYRQEVQRHLARYAEFLTGQLLREYAERNIGVLRLALVNPTDHVFEDVQVEFYLPGLVKAMNPDDLPRRAASPPDRPRPFGTASPALDFDFLGSSFRGLDIVIPRPTGYAPVLRPEIDNSGSARVTYLPVRLRARAHKPLDDVILIIEEPPGSVITGTWEASAANADGRIAGRLEVRVATGPLPVAELLASATPGRALTG